MFENIKQTEWGKTISTKKRAIMSEIAPRYATSKLYKSNFGKTLDLRNPTTFNEKIQFLKLFTYYNNPLITQCVDKYKVKEYLTKKGYGKLVVPLLGVYNSTEEIDWEQLPSKFVIKCNHGCGYNLLVYNKSLLNIKKTTQTINKWLEEDYWKIYVETQYKYVSKKIIVEELLEGKVFAFKFYCFNGEPQIFYISSDGENGEKDLYVDYFDMDFNHIDVTLGNHKHYSSKFFKPEKWDELKNLARVLSYDFPFVRVDLYENNGKIYFSEFTFIPTGGFMHLTPSEIDFEWGKMLKI